MPILDDGKAIQSFAVKPGTDPKSGRRGEWDEDWRKKQDEGGSMSFYEKTSVVRLTG